MPTCPQGRDSISSNNIRACQHDSKVLLVRFLRIYASKAPKPRFPCDQPNELILQLCSISQSGSKLEPFAQHGKKFSAKLLWAKPFNHFAPDDFAIKTHRILF
jgi:hypothetical protein